MALEFWYEFASTYSYPAAMRIARLAEAAGVTVEWRPFLLGPIFAAQGWRDSPFNLYPAKGEYMWRDMARICAREGLVLQKPVRFPQNSLKAARVALSAPDIAGFSRAVYVANFAERKDIADDAVLSEILGSDSRALSQAPEIKERLKAQTDAAMARGIFGAPSFVVDGELFWGNDRLEEAINFAADPSRIVAEELARTDPAIVARLRPWLIDPPQFTLRQWDYGPSHELREFLPCWIVLREPSSAVAIAYSPKGFGPESPWGLVWIEDGLQAIGQDGAWFASLAAAFCEL